MQVLMDEGRGYNTLGIMAIIPIHPYLIIAFLSTTDASVMTTGGDDQDHPRQLVRAQLLLVGGVSIATAVIGRWDVHEA